MPVSLFESVEVEERPGSGISCEISGDGVDVSALSAMPPERNLCVKAVRAMQKALGRPEELCGCRIRVVKRVPVGAGMAGGSADAAAVLRGLNRLLGRRFDRRELEKLAEEIGSDVPFCVAGGTALARGRGEVLEDLEPMPECQIVVCKPGFSISTPELFRKLDQAGLKRHPDTEGMLAALRNQDLKAMSVRMYNVFEEVDDRRMRIVAEIKSVMLDYGALGAIMTGTGSAVFGVYSDRSMAEKCAEELRREHRFCKVAEPVGRQKI